VAFGYSKTAAWRAFHRDGRGRTRYVRQSGASATSALWRAAATALRRVAAIFCARANAAAHLLAQPRAFLHQRALRCALRICACKRVWRKRLAT